MRALIVGSTTIDVVRGVTRVGGSTYYCGLTLSKHLHDETHVLTPIDERSSNLVKRTFSGAGVRLHTVECARIPQFTIRDGKAVDVVAGDCAIPADVARRVIKSVKPDIVLVTPVYNEIAIDDYVELLESVKWVKVKSLDIQGLVRVVASGGIKCVWRDEILKLMSTVSLTHGHVKEFCFADDEVTVVRALVSNEDLRNSAVAVSMDSRGLYLITRGGCYRVPSLQVTGVDEVGAGDVFTAVASHYMAVEGDLQRAIVKGVIAASLKVSRATGNWFTVEELTERLSHVSPQRILPPATP